jgi:hypothetical protein
LPRLSTPSKGPIELIGWNWWDWPKRNLIPDQARGNYNNRSRTPPKKPFLGHRRSSIIPKYAEYAATFFAMNLQNHSYLDLVENFS